MSIPQDSSLPDLARGGLPPCCAGGAPARPRPTAARVLHRLQRRRLLRHRGRRPVRDGGRPIPGRPGGRALRRPDALIGQGSRAVVNRARWRVGAAEAGDRFGFAIAVGDVDCDEFTDLVVGSPYEDVGTAVDSGYVQIVWGAAGGLGSGSPSRQSAPRRASARPSTPVTSSATRSTCSRTSAKGEPRARCVRAGRRRPGFRRGRGQRRRLGGHRWRQWTAAT